MTRFKGLGLLVVMVFLFGCSGFKDEELASLPPQAAGKKVFEAKCMNCHTIAGKGGTRGPNLSNVGGRIDLETLQKFITNPSSVKPKSAMRKISLSEKQIEWVAGYLSELK